MKKTFARLEDLGNLPDEVISHVLKMRPDLKNKSNKWVDTQMASGQFTEAMERILPDPNNQVYGYELYNRTVNYAVNTRQLKGKYATINKLEKNMKFDVGIINPWYGKRDWYKAVQKLRSHIHDDGMIVLISPDSTQSKSPWGEKVRNFLIENGIQERWNVTNAFPTVDSGRLSAYFMDLKSPANLKCLENNSVESEILDRMIKLTETVPAFKAVRGRQDITYTADKSDTKTKTHTVVAYVKVAKEKLHINYVEEKYKRSQKGYDSGKRILINRHFGKNDPDPYYIIDDITDTQLGYGVIAIDVSSHTNEKDMMRLLTHPIYRKILAYLKGGSHDINQSHLALLPNFSLDKVEDLDEFLSQQFNLTESERIEIYA